MGKRKHNVRTQITVSVDISTKDELNSIYQYENTDKAIQISKSEIVARLIRTRYEEIEKIKDVKNRTI